MSQAALSRASQNNSSLDDNCEGEEEKHKALLHIFVYIVLDQFCKLLDNLI